MTEAPHGDESGGHREAATYTPALVTLTLDVRALRGALLDGFESRRAVLEWEQRLTVRTLGQLPQRFYREIGRQFRGDGDNHTLLAALLGGEGRLSPAVAADVRERLAATMVVPAFHRAFRHLRKDAGEYVGDANERPHDPERQSHIAMRPSLSELDDRQAEALGALLDGLDDTEAVLTWGETLELATYGELPQGFVPRCYRERETRRLVCGGDDTAPARELFAAHHLLPRFNRGVRVLAARSSELPEVEHQDPERTTA